MDLTPFLGLHDPVSSLTHLLAAVVAFGASYSLYRRGRGDSLRTLCLSVFSATLLFMFATSGIYHGLHPGHWRELFRRLDYAAIWLVIAGSATPIHFLMLKGHWRWSLTALFWGVALSCLVIVEVYFGVLPYWEVVTAYIAVGMLGIVSFSHIMMDYGVKEAALLFGGGLAYSAGAIIDYVDSPIIVINGVFGPHELFHLFVIAGALQHWLFIYNSADGSFSARALRRF